MVSSSREGTNGCGVQDEKVVSPVQRDKTEVVREWEVHIAYSCSRNARIVAYGHFHVFGPEDSSGFGDSRVEVEARTGDLEGSLWTGLSIRNFDLITKELSDRAKVISDYVSPRASHCLSSVRSVFFGAAWRTV